MASTMTCGELKNTTFTKNEGGFEDDLSFKKVKEKSAPKQFKSNDKSKVFQVRPGARIIKLNSKEQYNTFKQELADRMNIPVDQINSIEDILKDINSIYDMNSEDALKYLTNFKGIGMKVASCILLFAYQKFDVYPVDTWVKKYMLENYNIEGKNNIRKYCKEKYKEYSGLAIQYMFNGRRNM